MVNMSVTAMVLWLVCIQGAHSIRCFQCGTTSPDGDCYLDYQGFVNASMGLDDPNYYVKDCAVANPAWDRCMIETLEQDGTIKHFHRGCHDGKDFGDETNGRFYSERFLGLNPTNKTTCAHVIMLTCYTFCDTDLCNGPQPPPVKPDPCANYTFDYDDDSELSDICDAAVHRISLVSIIIMVVIAAVVGADQRLF